MRFALVSKPQRAAKALGLGWHFDAQRCKHVHLALSISVILKEPAFRVHKQFVELGGDLGSGRREFLTYVLEQCALTRVREEFLPRVGIRTIDR